MTTTHQSPRHEQSERPAKSHGRSEKNGRALSIERRSQRGLKYGAGL